MADEALDAHELVAVLNAAADGSAELTINDLPKEILVSVFIAARSPWWVRHTFPRVCKAWAELYRTKDASPLHAELVVDFYEEVEGAGEVSISWLREVGLLEDPRGPAVHASRVISWAEKRSGSVRGLHLEGGFKEALKDFTSEDLGMLVAVAASSLTEISINSDLSELLKKPFWNLFRESVVHAGRLRSFTIDGYNSDLPDVDVEALGKLAGSLEEVVLDSCYDDEREASASAGLSRFPESFLVLKKLRRLNLTGHPRITTIPAGISSLKKLERLELGCSISSLPKEVGKLSGLTRLDLAWNKNLGDLPQDEAFPAELGKLKSLRELNLYYCGLRAVPAFVGKLKSLEDLELSFAHDDAQIAAQLDSLIEGCPRLRKVVLYKERNRGPWTPKSLTDLAAFKARLLAKNPSAKVVCESEGHGGGGGGV